MRPGTGEGLTVVEKRNSGRSKSQAPSDTRISSAKTPAQNSGSERTKAEGQAISRIRDREVSSVRLAIGSDEKGRTTLRIDHKDAATGAIALMDALGIARTEFVYAFAEQIVNVATKGQNVAEAPPNAMLAAIIGMKPRDEAEAMLISQMVATHNLAMMFARRLNHVENIPQQDSAVNGLTKLTRTYATQMAALKQYRTGGEQRVIVQRVDVRDGGQAVVGVVNSTQGGGETAKNEGQPHALADARSSAMLCDVQEKPEAVPRTGSERAFDVQDARWDKPRRA